MKISGYIRVLIVCVMATSVIAEAEPLRNDVLLPIAPLWQENPRACYSYVRKIVNTMNAISASRAVPDDAIILAEDDLQKLFTQIRHLPVQPNLADSAFRLDKKWTMMRELAHYVPALKTTGKTWLEMAAVMGDMRSQMILDFKPHNVLYNGIDMTKTKSEMQAIRDEITKKNQESFYQNELRLICDNLKHERGAIRAFAATLPPDERKQFLDKIKELARSDEEEAKRLDEPYE